jgi:hypothetical protein
MATGVCGASLVMVEPISVAFSKFEYVSCTSDYMSIHVVVIHTFSHVSATSCGFLSAQTIVLLTQSRQ